MTHNTITNDDPLLRHQKHRLRFAAPNWRKTIARSELPDDVQGLIRTVIKKSRLMQFEKTEVVQELIAHFQDGQSAGKSHQQMIANFGDPQITAELIHRSKIRNRPIMFKIMQVFAWSTSSVIAFYLVVLVYFHTGRPQPTIDFMADIRQTTRDIEDNDRAWPIYLPIFIKYGFADGGEF